MARFLAIFAFCLVCSVSQGSGVVSLVDGSNLKVSMTSPSIDMQTLYGKLSFPVSDIVRIQFRHSVLDEAKVKTNLANLGSPQYKEREAATRYLEEQGIAVARYLEAAIKSTDAETSKRASILLAKAKKMEPEGIRDDDIVYTKKGHSFSGRLTSTSVTFSSAHLKDLSLPLHIISSYSLLHQTHHVEVDAGLYTDPVWLDTKITIYDKMRVAILAEGVVDIWPATPGQYRAPPSGYKIAAKLGDFWPGALVAKVGDGVPFMPGESWEGGFKTTGTLYLKVMGAPWPNGGKSAGFFRVVIKGLN